MSEQDAPDETDAAPEWGYAYRASLMGAPWEFYLLPDRLHWRVGQRQGFVRYEDVTFIRLSFRPSTIQMHRYTAEIWSKSGPKLTMASTSWKGLVQQEPHDAAYSAFLGELHGRIAKTGAQPALRGGSPFLLYWPGVVIFAAACIGFASVGFNVMMEQGLSSALILTLFAAILVWQGGLFFYLNWPRIYRFDQLPPDLLPVPKVK